MNQKGKSSENAFYSHVYITFLVILSLTPLRWVGGVPVSAVFTKSLNSYFFGHLPYYVLFSVLEIFPTLMYFNFKIAVGSNFELVQWKI